MKFQTAALQTTILGLAVGLAGCQTRPLEDRFNQPVVGQIQANQQNPALVQPRGIAASQNVIQVAESIDTEVSSGQQSTQASTTTIVEPLPAPPAEVTPAEDSAPQLPPAEESAQSYEEPVPSESTTAVEHYPIDFPTVLRLAGASNWDIRVATERVSEARAQLDAAEALWLPSLTAGIGYTKHEGKIQSTPGPVLDVSRNALFVGGGAGIGDAPLAGGGGGPARLFVSLSLADAIFKPLVAHQLVHAAQNREAAVFNDTLLATAVTYFDLVRAQGQLSIAKLNLSDSQELLKQTESFVEAGKGAPADTLRMSTEVKTRQQLVVSAELATKVTSAELARLLTLDPQTQVFALEEHPVPVEMIDEDMALADLVTQGTNSRPEICEFDSRLEARRQNMQAEKWRPAIPHLQIGVSGGGFGGGVNDSLSGLDGRGDVDLLAVWQIRNLGFGNMALQDETSSQHRQALYAAHRIRDLVATEVTQAYHEVHAERKRIALAEANVEDATKSYEQNLDRIRGLAGLPLEALQALQAVSRARDDYLKTIIAYNQAQLRLRRAIGMPPTE